MMRVKTPHFLRTSLETFPMQKCKEMHNAREAYRCIFVVCRGFAPAGARRGTEPVWRLSGRPRHPFGAAFLLAGIGICKGFAPAGATKGRSPSGGFPIALWKPSAPTYKLVAFSTLVGRGGSVSCRDRTKLQGNRACGREAAAFRSPPPPLRVSTYKLVRSPT